MVRLEGFLVAALGVCPAVANFVPGSYIIEYEDGHDSTTFTTSLSEHKLLSTNTRVTRQYDYQLFKGAVVRMDDLGVAEGLSTVLSGLPTVKRVWRDRIMTLPEYTVDSIGPEGSIMSATAGSVDGLDPYAVPTAGNFTPHLMTQINKMREAGYTGKGIKIGIVDTGIDYLHPALGGCFGQGCLVVNGTDFVGDNFTHLAFNEPVPDPDPIDTCRGHGTHVAGIIAAQVDKNPFGITGAAQGVQLGAYRVFGCTGDTPESLIIDGYLRAFQDGMDIISASLGGLSGWSEDPLDVITNRLIDQGVACIAAAGNSGELGLFNSNSPGDGRAAGAASVNNLIYPMLLTQASFSVDGGAKTPFSFYAEEPYKWNGAVLPLWHAGLESNDTTARAAVADACEPYPDSTPDLSSKMVFSYMGNCSYKTMLDNAAKKGAKYMMMYSDNVLLVKINGSALSDSIRGFGLVTDKQAEAWLEKLRTGSQVMLSMPFGNISETPFTLYQRENTLSGGYVSNYTSWGPTFEAGLEPQFASPGGRILSTYPRAVQPYAVLSGTSMATPIVAAAYAIMMQALGTKNFTQITNALSATAKPLKFHNGNTEFPMLAPVAQQGGGIMQVYDATFSKVSFSVSGLSFNDSDHFIAKQSFVMQNQGDSAVQYNLEHQGAGTVYTFSNDSDNHPDIFAVVQSTISDDYAKVDISPASVSIPPGGSAAISVSVTPPATDDERLPVYSGYIVAKPVDGGSPSLSLPYIGIAGSLHAQNIIHPAENMLANMTQKQIFNESQQEPDPVAVKDGFVFELPPPKNITETYPTNDTGLAVLFFHVNFGTPYVRVDVVPLDGQDANTTTVLGTPTIGQLFGSPLSYISRQTVSLTWLGMLDDTTFAPEGKYKLSIKGLRINGDVDKEEDYDVAETVSFEIKYLKEKGTG